MENNFDSARMEIRISLQEWATKGTTQRKVIARRQSSRKFKAEEAVAMRAAFDLVMEGKIGIAVKLDPQSRASNPTIIFIAERVG